MANYFSRKQRFMNFQVGQVWTARDGSHETIVDITNDKIYPVRGASGQTYTDQGHLIHKSKDENPSDLVFCLEASFFLDPIDPNKPLIPGATLIDPARLAFIEKITHDVFSRYPEYSTDPERASAFVREAVKVRDELVNQLNETPGERVAKNFEVGF